MSKIASLKKKAADTEKKSPEKAIPIYVELLAEMEKSPEDRYQDAEHLMLALESSSAARGWSRNRAEQWWTERCSGDICYPEAPIAAADLSVTHDSAAVTRM